MKPIKRDIWNVRGDTLTFSVKTPLDAAVESMYFSVKKYTTDNHYVIQKALGDGIVDDTEENDDTKLYTISVESEDTNSLEPGDYIYDLQINIDGCTLTPIYGMFKVTADITREV